MNNYTVQIDSKLTCTVKADWAEVREDGVLRFLVEDKVTSGSELVACFNTYDNFTKAECHE